MHPRAAGTRTPLRARAHAPAGRLRRAHAHTHTRVPAYTRTAPLYPKKPTYPQVTCHSESLVLLCCPSSARLPLFCCGKRPHMSANTSRQEPASAEQRQPGLPSSPHKAAGSYFQAGSLSPLWGHPALFLPLCLSLLFACPATAQHTSIIHCLSPSFQAKPITDGVLANGLMPYLPTGYLCSSYNPLETIKRIRLSFKTSHICEQTWTGNIHVSIPVTLLRSTSSAHSTSGGCFKSSERL